MLVVIRCRGYSFTLLKDLAVKSPFLAACFEYGETDVNIDVDPHQFAAAVSYMHGGPMPDNRQLLDYLGLSTRTFVQYSRAADDENLVVISKRHAFGQWHVKSKRLGNETGYNQPRLSLYDGGSTCVIGDRVFYLVQILIGRGTDNEQEWYVIREFNADLDEVREYFVRGPSELYTGDCNHVSPTMFSWNDRLFFYGMDYVGSSENSCHSIYRITLDADECYYTQNLWQHWPCVGGDDTDDPVLCETSEQFVKVYTSVSSWNRARTVIPPPFFLVTTDGEVNQVSQDQANDAVPPQHHPEYKTPCCGDTIFLSFSFSIPAT